MQGADDQDPPADPATHWLHRLTPDQWLAAADTELCHGEQALARRAARPGVTHARRAAGMALNAVLALAEDARFGRSYMDHLVALASDDRAPEAVRDAAQRLRATPPSAPTLITLGKPDLSALDPARRIVAYAAERVAALRAPVS
jgi:hypothetical protein